MSALDLPFLLDTSARLLAAVPLTLALFVLSVTLGGVLAVGLTTLRVRGGPGSLLARGYVAVFRGSPLLLQVFLLYYGLSQFPTVRHSAAWPVLRDPFTCAVISLALCTAGYTTEIFRGAILAIPAGQVEAARACGMSRLTLLRRLIVPLAVRQALPAYSTELILMVKSTSLASVITVSEVSGVAQHIIAQTYRVLEVFLCAAAIYLAINFALARCLMAVEHALSPHRRMAPLRDVASAAAVPAEEVALH